MGARFFRLQVRQRASESIPKVPDWAVRTGSTRLTRMAFLYRETGPTLRVIWRRGCGDWNLLVYIKPCAELSQFHGC